MPRSGNQKVHKTDSIQGDTISVGIGRGYWIVTPVRWLRRLTALLNNSKGKNPICSIP